MKKPELPPSIIKAIKNDWHHVFFIVNPITAILTRLIIDKYRLNQKKIILISFRSSDLSLFENHILKFKVLSRWYDGYFEKLFFISPKGKRIKKTLDIHSDKYILYAGWAFREVNFLIKQKECKGHIYIEEGQGAYMNFKPYNFNKVSIKERVLNNFKNRLLKADGTGIGNCWRDDAFAFIGTSNKCFPYVESYKTYIVDDFISLKKYYVPKLIGKKIIGLTCSASRVKTEELGGMLNKLITKLPPDSAIKPHPSYTSTDNEFSLFINEFNKQNTKNLLLCNKEINLELEMLFEKKHFKGDMSSLQIYARRFGSTYEMINLYNK